MYKSTVRVYEQGREGLSPVRAALQPSPLRREISNQPSREEIARRGILQGVNLITCLLGCQEREGQKML